MKEDFLYIELFELYKGLLTDKQQEMFYNHYFLDLSYQEIAETSDMARQSVFDTVKGVKEKLAEYERILRLKEQKDKLNNFAEKLEKELSDELKDIINA